MSGKNIRLKLALKSAALQISIQNGLVLAGKLVATQHTVLPFALKYKMLTILCKYFVQNKPFGITYTRKNLTTCSKSANKPSTSCIHTVLQVVNRFGTSC